MTTTEWRDQIAAGRQAALDQIAALTAQAEALKPQVATADAQLALLDRMIADEAPSAGQ